VPVQRCTVPLPIPLLPLWAIRPVQSLSACTTVHCTFTYNSTPHMGRTASTEPQCLYNGALYLNPYFTPPMDRKACTEPQCLYKGVLYLYLYSTPPMVRTACKEPQCLYNGALYLYLYHYSPYGPYGQYRASVPVQRCTVTLPIPLLTI